MKHIDNGPSKATIFPSAGVMKAHQKFALIIQSRASTNSTTEVVHSSKIVCMHLMVLNDGAKLALRTCMHRHGRNQEIA